MIHLLRYGLGLVLLNASLANAAIMGWGQNGSEIIKDLNNPWFVKDENGKAFEVRYCVQVKQEFISLPVASIVVPLLIQSAFEYWRNDFKSAYDPVQTGVAKHTFKHVCNDTTDLTFYVGWLPQNIRERMPDLKHTIATTVRTEYDDVKLRAKGFVYIAPDKGPDALSVNNPDLIEQPWGLKGIKIGPLSTGGGLLQKVVAHEIGHIFGLSHADYNAAFSYFNVMNAQFGEMILSKRFDAEVREFFATPSLFNQETVPIPGFNLYFPFFNQLSTSVALYLGDDYSNGQERKGARKFFDLPADESLDIEIHFDKKEFSVSSYRDEGDNGFAPEQSFSSPWQMIEEVDATFMTMFRILNKNQTIFKFPIDEREGLVPGPMMRTIQAKTVFKNTDTGIQREVGVRANGANFILSGIDDKGLVPDVLGRLLNLDRFKGLHFSNQNQDIVDKKSQHKAMLHKVRSLRKKINKQ